MGSIHADTMRRLGAPDAVSTLAGIAGKAKRLDLSALRRQRDGRFGLRRTRIPVLPRYFISDHGIGARIRSAVLENFAKTRSPMRIECARCDSRNWTTHDGICTSFSISPILRMQPTKTLFAMAEKANAHWWRSDATHPAAQRSG
ncbi:MULTISPECIES: hypothetical protein [Lysobacter]|uniref:hypothetical protein n=1 Tax=Lysobacter TaxID=68 RepID=UPI001F26B613|nr:MULTISPECIES: hypothetical protein [Lysobacter]UJB19403.1 hypothetical protein L1A79_24375 [Lysobacter capsici]UJQ26872.1 hypothetical protein L2D09_15510 [Lysobacter gummosus]